MERRPGGTGQDGVGKGIAILSSFLLVGKAKGVNDTVMFACGLW